MSSWIVSLLTTFRDPAPDVPARIVDVAAATVFENWRDAPPHAYSAPRHVLDVDELSKAWSASSWTPETPGLLQYDHVPLPDRPEVVSVDFGFTPWAESALASLSLDRWPGWLQASLSITVQHLRDDRLDREVELTQRAAERDDRWTAACDAARAREDAEPGSNEADPVAEAWADFEAVAFAIAGVAPSTGPEETEGEAGYHSVLPPTFESRVPRLSVYGFLPPAVDMAGFYAFADRRPADLPEYGPPGRSEWRAYLDDVSRASSQ